MLDSPGTAPKKKFEGHKLVRKKRVEQHQRRKEEKISIALDHIYASL